MLAQEDKLPHFSFIQSKLSRLADYVINVIRLSYPTPNEAKAPFHSRWRHFETGDPLCIEKMISTWHCDQLEKTRRLLDLALVSVLLDAGAGPTWKFKEPETENFYNRSEGLGIASLHMFKMGNFSIDPAKNPNRVDAKALANLPDDAIAKAFQVSETNPLVGCAGRTELLKRLGKSMTNYAEFFTGVDGSIRPGNMVDYLAQHQNLNGEVSIATLWNVVLHGLQDVWPESRTRIDGQNMGTCGSYLTYQNMRKGEVREFSQIIAVVDIFALRASSGYWVQDYRPHINDWYDLEGFIRK
ncbi:hypothetical protein PsorP6_014621 [Peronosclerospora sorghi]|uniref:Uncharacterized protein n=1 Tax=Peronosclerospora sorghi TaxID=230839 RepID=A0ACC0VU61_9STRA|nr:hypothetical protein PsorP6_014621 [Peronosclerospora sorghi]